MKKSKKVKLLLKYYNKKHRLPNKNEKYKGVNIYKFVEKIKNAEITLSPNELEQLKAIGVFPHRKKIAVHKKVLLLTEFFEEFGRWPKQREVYKDIKIGMFSKSIRSSKTSISDDDKNLLNSLNFPFDSNLIKDSVHEKVLLLTEFFEEFGRWPKIKEIYKDINIGTFSSSVRFNKTYISDDDKKLLNSLNFPFDSNLIKDSVHKKVLLLTEFFEEFSRWPKDTELYKDIKIGKFFGRVKFNRTSISDSDKELLNNLNFPFNTNLKKDYVHKKVLLLTEFFKEFGRWPKQREVYKDINIGIFSKDVRFNKTSISDYDKKLLNSLNFPFNSNLGKDSVHKKVILLIEFFKEFGRWPKIKEVYKDTNIGYFFNNVKSNHTSISNSDKELLNNLNFPFYTK